MRLAITSFNVFILKMACLTHFQVSEIKNTIMSKSVVAVPMATPIAGLIHEIYFGNTPPKRMDKPTLRMVPAPIAIK